MQVVILAAGLGSRLDRSKRHLPKCLTPLITGQSILEYQLAVLRLFVSLQQVWIVVGYQKEHILDSFPDLTFIYNPHFATENTAKSLERALLKIEDDVLWLNGDVLFQPLILEQLLEQQQTAAIVYQTLVGEEEVKYKADSQGYLLDISKEVQEPQGEAIGINFYKYKDLPLLKSKLHQCRPHAYFEKAMQLCIDEGQRIAACVVPSSTCIEIDFPSDLIRANQMLQLWQ